jgi:hypothetical protein
VVRHWPKSILGTQPHAGVRVDAGCHMRGTGEGFSDHLLHEACVLLKIACMAQGVQIQVFQYAVLVVGSAAVSRASHQKPHPHPPGQSAHRRGQVGKSVRVG